jgi:undecaprenyl-diphosphatase
MVFNLIGRGVYGIIYRIRLGNMVENKPTGIRVSIVWLFQDLKKLYSAKIVFNKLPLLTGFILVMAVYTYDVQISNFFVQLSNYNVVERISQVITFLGDGIFAVVLAIIFGVPSGTRQFGRAMFSASLYTGLNVRILKILLGRPRPGMVQPVIHGLASILSYDSFPSGHSASVFVLAVLLAAKYPRCKWVFYGLAVLVSISRIVISMHWTADVIAGALIGALSGALAVRCFGIGKDPIS